MSRRRTSSAGTVSLFPFLAVLVCAMGALILLLLVTTRRIRQQALTSEPVHQPIDVDMPSPFPGTDDVPKPLAAASTPHPADEPILPLFATDPPPQPHDPTPELLAQLAQLQAQHAAALAVMKERRRTLSQLEAAADSETQTLTELAGQTAELEVEKQRLSNLYVRLKQQKDDATRRADDLRQQIQQARAQSASADSKFAIIPYDGHSGTRRHPIIIECRADRITFASEGISLSATDLNGFTPRFNPLLYVTQALIRYWDRRDRMSAADDIGEPYVLLVVRPGGTTAYYVARMLLAGIREPFGYELVTEDQEFVWPDRDLEAVAICRTIIDRMLAERDEMMEVALQHGAELEDFSNNHGAFRLEEIDRRLKPPERDVTINGQRFSRDSGGQAAWGPNRHDDPRSSQNSDRYSHSPRSGGTVTGNDGGHRPPSHSSSTSKSGSERIVTRQNTAVTRADRMPEWLREGTARAAKSIQDDSLHRSESGAPTETTAPFAGSPAPIDINDPLQSATGRLPNSPASGAAPPTVDDQQRPPESLTFSRHGTAGKPTIDPRRPQWGIRSANGTIGFEREVKVRISGYRIEVGTEATFQLYEGLSAVDLQRVFAQSIDAEVRSWGEPPRSFYWVPSLRFEIAPGSSQHHERLRKIAGAWEVRSSAEYVHE